MKHCFSRFSGFSRRRRLSALALLLAAACAPALLSAAPAFWLDLESGAAFTGYNDVQIPADTGTRLSLADDLSPDPVWYYRLRAGADLGRHTLSLLYAPLRVVSSGTAESDIDFYGETFTAGTPLEGTYVFNSYRLTWSYVLVDGARFRFAAGISGKIRDAYIALKSTGAEAKRTDLGFVPLIHLDARWRLGRDLAVELSGDGLAAPQGRAEDFMAALLWNAAPDLQLRLGYRILEGGSDGGGSVYTFSMFHYAVAGVRWRL